MGSSNPPKFSPKSLWEALGSAGRRHPLWVWSLWAVLPAWTYRAVTLGDKHATWHLYDGRGFLSDLVPSLIIALTAYACIRKLPRLLGWPAGIAVATAWLFVNAGNHEHLAVLDSNMNPAFAEFMGDANFALGSILHIRRLWLFALFVVVWPLGLIRIPIEEHARPLWKHSAWVLVGTLAALLVWSIPPTIHPWRFAGFLEEYVAATPVLRASKLEGGRGRVDYSPTARSRFMVDQNLSGESILLAPGELDPKTPPNIMLVMLEGITGGWLDSLRPSDMEVPPIRMPHLDAVAKENLSYSRFLSHQRQTDRGEYALLCGDHPKLKATTARMRFMAQGEYRRCLPEALKENGYHTAYLQSAGLSFMAKDEFMPKVGFEVVRGKRSFENPIQLSGWGVDDKTLYRETLSYLKNEAPKDRPWFVTLLTVGTHHPFTVPDDYPTSLGEDPQVAAVRYADETISEFVEDLRAAGHLDNTLLLITADEAAGMKGGRSTATILDAITQHWTFMIASGPRVPKGMETGHFTQSDLALSIADYLDLSETFPGRSIFRRYPTERPWAFAHIYSRRVYLYDPLKTSMLLCNDDLNTCGSFQSPAGQLLSAEWQEAPLDEESRRTLADAQRYSIRPFGGAAAKELELVALKEVHTYDPEDTKRLRVFGGQQVYTDPNRALEVTFDVEVVRADKDVALFHRLVSRNAEHEKTNLFSSRLPAMKTGDRFRIQYFYGQTEPFEQVNSQLDLDASIAPNTQLRFSEAKLRIVELRPDLPLHRPVVIAFEQQRSEARAALSKN